MQANSATLFNLRLMNRGLIFFPLFVFFIFLFGIFSTSCKNDPVSPVKTEDSLILTARSFSAGTSFYSLRLIMNDFFPEKLFAGQYGRIRWFDKVAAVYEAYKSEFEKIELFYNPEAFDVVFYLRNGKKIHFARGRMVYEELLEQQNSYLPYIYYYPRGRENKLNNSLEMGVLNFDLIYDVYGRTVRERRNNLVRVNFLGYRLQFNKQNQAAENLKKVGEELALLIKEDKEIRKLFASLHSISSYVERNVAYKNQPSLHSMGIAIDLLPNKQEKEIYWFWTAGRSRKWWSVPFDERYYFPEKVVAIFEKYGFIYGGKWKKYDGMHFEYAPQMLYQNIP